MSLFGRLFGRGKEVDFNGFTDWHSHILPGVDDGVKILDESLAILDEYEKMGFREVWMTPHIMEDMPNATESLRNKFTQLEDAYNGPICLNLASENMIDLLFSERLAARDFLPIGRQGKMLLVETSCFNSPMGFEKTMERIKDAGLCPLIAHPERYAYVESSAEFGRWKDMGCGLQLNLLSLGGFYGPRAMELSRMMLKNRMYDCVGTDIHKPAQVTALKKLKLSPELLDNLQLLLYTQY